MKKLEAMLVDHELSPFQPVNGQNLTFKNAALDATVGTQSTINDQPGTDHIDHEFFESLLKSEVINGPQSSSHPLDAVTSQPLPAQLDFPSSPRMPSHRSPLLPQDMQPPSTPIHSYPPGDHETIKDYRNGNIFPSSYLARIRGPVDSTFSNDNWGDEHYFSAPRPFRYLEDFRPNPHHKVDNHAIGKGLHGRAIAIPEQTIEDSLKSFEESLNKLGGGNSGALDPPLSFEEMKQRIQGCIAETEHLPLLPDLDRRVQRQKIIHSRRAMQGINAAAVVAPGIHPFRIGTAPFITQSLSSHRRVDKRRLHRNARAEQELREIIASRDGAGRTSAWPQPRKKTAK